MKTLILALSTILLAGTCDKCNKDTSTIPGQENLEEVYQYVVPANSSKVTLHYNSGTQDIMLAGRDDTSDGQTENGAYKYSELKRITVTTGDGSVIDNKPVAKKKVRISFGTDSKCYSCPDDFNPNIHVLGKYCDSISCCPPTIECDLRSKPVKIKYPKELALIPLVEIYTNKQ